MSRVRAPSARRTPISWVRSTTETNMMFVITIAPTTSEIPEIRIISAKAPAEMLPPERLEHLRRDEAERIVVVEPRLRGGAG